MGELSVDIQNINSISPSKLLPQITGGFIAAVGFIQVVIGFAARHISRNIPSESNSPEFYDDLGKTFLIAGGVTMFLGGIVSSVQPVYDQRRFNFHIISV